MHVTRLDQDLELPPQMQDLLSGGLGGWERDDGGLLLPLQVAQHSAQNLFRPVSGSNLSVVPGGRRGRTSEGCYSAFLSITTEVTPETEQQYACTCMHIRTHTHAHTCRIPTQSCMSFHRFIMNSGLKTSCHSALLVSRVTPLPHPYASLRKFGGMWIMAS